MNLDKEDKVRWEPFKTTKLDEGTTITLGMKIHSTSLPPMLMVQIIPEKGKPVLYRYQPASGITGTLDLFKFKMGRKKRFSFPFELESFEINTGFLKTYFKRKSN